MTNLSIEKNKLAMDLLYDFQIGYVDDLKKEFEKKEINPDSIEFFEKAGYITNGVTERKNVIKRTMRVTEKFMHAYESFYKEPTRMKKISNKIMRVIQGYY